MAIPPTMWNILSWKPVVRQPDSHNRMMGISESNLIFKRPVRLEPLLVFPSRNNIPIMIILELHAEFLDTCTSGY